MGLKKKDEFNCGEIINGKKALMYDRTKGEASTEFQNLMLKKITREKGKKGSNLVTEEKFSIIFSTELNWENIEFQLCIQSMPIVVVSHDSQKIQGMATITWTNAVEESFVDTESLSWGQIGETLSRKWNFACGRPLSDENIYHLACKVFQTDNLDPTNFKEKHLSWTKFGKEVLTGHNFTFWEWFHSML